MNNGMMWFDPRANKPNSIAPGKRPLSNMCPSLLRTINGDTYALGASGGRRIMPAVMQLISFITDFGMDLDTAMHQGRIDVSGSPVISIDSALSTDIVEAVHEVAAQHQNMTAKRATHGVYPALFGCPNVLHYARNGDHTGAAFVSSPWAKVSTQSA